MLIRGLINPGECYLAKYLTSPDYGEDAVGHMLDEGVGDGVIKLAAGERVYGDAFPFESLCTERRIAGHLLWMELRPWLKGPLAAQCCLEALGDLPAQVTKVVKEVSPLH